MRAMLRAMVLMAAVGVLAGCSGAVPGYAPDVQPLAKVDGWRFEPFHPEVPFGLVEVAYDRDSAEQAWRENVPEDLGEGDSAEGKPGRYGSLDDVDFSAQVLVVWHSGQSGSCPSWLAGIETDGAAVTIERGEHVPQDGCTDDYNPYRMVVAVAADRLPEPGLLPTEDVVIDTITDGRVSAYPDERVPNQSG